LRELHSGQDEVMIGISNYPQSFALNYLF